MQIFGQPQFQDAGLDREGVNEVNHIKRTIKWLFNKLGCEMVTTNIKKEEFKCTTLPIPSQEIVKRATTYFSNSFPISPHCGMTQEEIEKEIRDYYWDFPIEFGGRLVESDNKPHMGIHGRHYQRYFHIFPAVLSMTGGSLSGNTVLDIGCNAGFWSIQARLAGADSVLGVEAGPKNIKQANFILQLIGLDGIEYRVMNAYDVSKEALGEFDITFFMGILYHLDKPIVALERLYEVTKNFAVVDTLFVESGIPLLTLKEDFVSTDQKFFNRLAFVPSKGIVPLMLRHVGFREVFWVDNSTYYGNLPRKHRKRITGARGVFIAVK